MTTIQLPISKSIANRLLVLQALHNVPLLKLSGQNVPADVKLMRDALEALKKNPNGLNIQNCGTAMRFLTAYCAQRNGYTVFLDGDERMHQRPIGPLVDALCACGADIDYWGEEGFPPLVIRGKQLYDDQPVTVDCQLSTQFASALLLIGIDVQTDSASPYIAMTREIIKRWKAGQRNLSEHDWSAAAFWYEYIAVHGGELFLAGLHQNDIQGDKVVADIFRNFGVQTFFEPNGVRISKIVNYQLSTINYQLSFSDCPDLYPAVALTCRQLGIILQASGTEALRYKESNRLKAVRELRSYSDHRIAMALLAAGLPCDDIACIDKSYPTFYNQLCQLR